MKKGITVLDLLREQESILKLKKVIYNSKSLENLITVAEVNRPGLAFVGFYDYFGYKRLQIIGKTEMTYLNKLSDKDRRERIIKYMSYKLPCIIFARSMKIPKLFIEEAEKNNIVILKSSLTTTRLVGTTTLFLDDCFAPSVNIHGTLLDVYGVGVLILGGSGVGKSECALELVERGHRLVADDLVNISCKVGRFLMGTGVSFIRHHMEIRGLGIIDVRSVYGAGSVRNQKRIGLVVSLEDWDPKKEYERLGLEEKTYELLGIPLPHFVIPIKPGRNLAVLIEVATTSQRLKRMGIHPVKEIEKKMFDVMTKKTHPLDEAY
ncbi:HPr(Ser) kinase/phosphatase [bacterium]|nr:HPr(Ser) kinase/phosphatase [bacterium]